MSSPELWIPFYGARYLADTKHLDLAHHGAYLLLLIQYWAKGPLPDDDGELARIVGTDLRTWRKNLAPKLLPFFTRQNGRLHQKRADIELARQSDISSKRRAAANTRHHGDTQPPPPSEDRARVEQRNRLRRVEDGRKRGTHTEAEWQALLHACDDRCVMCGDGSPTKDHILPLYLGGSDAISNIQPLCLPCNAKKGRDRTDYRPKDWRERCKQDANAPDLHHANAMQMDCTSSADASHPVPITQYPLTSTEEKGNVHKNPLPLKDLGSSRAREEAANAWEKDFDIEPPERDDDAPLSDNPAVAAIVRRTAKACSMRTHDYGVVHSPEVQIAAAQQQPPDVVDIDTSGYRWAPADPIRSPAQQLAELLGIPIAEAERRVPCLT